MIQRKRQAGASDNLKYIALTVGVAILVVIGLTLLWPDDSEEPAVDQEAAPAQNRPAEPPEIKAVDLDEATTATPRPQTTAAPNDDSAESDEDVDIFNRGERKRPLTDGLAGGSEEPAKNPDAAAPTKRVNAIDFFDFGVLDGRVRIGIFGKGPIPDYKASVREREITIDMPGEFRYVEEFSRRLAIEALGVAGARLTRNARGMEMRIEVTAGLQHQPFLIEDKRGLIVAFEPRR